MGYDMSLPIVIVQTYTCTPVRSSTLAVTVRTNTCSPIGVGECKRVERTRDLEAVSLIPTNFERPKYARHSGRPSSNLRYRRTLEETLGIISYVSQNMECNVANTLQRGLVSSQVGRC